MFAKYYNYYQKLNYKLILINVNFIFKKKGFLFLLFLYKNIQINL